MLILNPSAMRFTWLNILMEYYVIQLDSMLFPLGAILFHRPPASSIVGCQCHSRAQLPPSLQRHNCSCPGLRDIQAGLAPWHGKTTKHCFCWYGVYFTASGCVFSSERKTKCKSFSYSAHIALAKPGTGWWYKVCLFDSNWQSDPLIKIVYSDWWVKKCSGKSRKLEQGDVTFYILSA